ncbi:AbiJ-NTD4 domain-containing protein [Pseudomonas sp. NMI760_13]|uniref:AbiJ-NTD4 domain-containing protein n=1 Tax=Pseudomonas sp. NMI760_13 TaxID=2903147 RepID=UPI001E3D1417|nr:hypothetical protein [Pseudomonas sp. NMI760_13]MCE0913011.1 hypothetical protein [Pseudomonas sp. NMI760_13]
MTDYFSDRENGPAPRVNQVISPVAWAAIVALVRAYIANGGFGFRFPVNCPEGAAPYGTDEHALGATVRALMPGLEWPLQTNQIDPELTFEPPIAIAPETLLALDFIEYVHSVVAKPFIVKRHEYYHHNHLGFNQAEGQFDFMADVNSIFARCGVAYELQSNGRIVRLLPPILRETLSRAFFRTGDKILDNAMEEARVKFSSPNPIVRREALERLWDAFERLKSLADADKKTSIAIILDTVASEKTFRGILESEAKQLTEIGNSFLIRHYEKRQVPVIDTDHVDYLFHRLFSFINLLLGRQ